MTVEIAIAILAISSFLIFLLMRELQSRDCNKQVVFFILFVLIIGVIYA